MKFLLKTVEYSTYSLSFKSNDTAFQGISQPSRSNARQSQRQNILVAVHLKTGCRLAFSSCRTKWCALVDSQLTINSSDTPTPTTYKNTTRQLFIIYLLLHATAVETKALHRPSPGHSDTLGETKTNSDHPIPPQNQNSPCKQNDVENTSLSEVEQFIFFQAFVCPDSCYK